MPPIPFHDLAGRRATPEQHIQASDYLRATAENALLTGDLVLASEAYWGVVAHMLQAIAERRGMRHISNLDFKVIKNWLIEETRNDDLDDWYFLTYRLHQNFYRIVMTRDEVEICSRLALALADAARPFAQ